MLIAEARKFGLDRRIATELVAPWTAIMQWRTEAALLRTDSTLDVRASNDARSLFQVALPRTDEEGRPWNATGTRQVIWYDVVDRQVGRCRESRGNSAWTGFWRGRWAGLGAEFM